MNPHIIHTWGFKSTQIAIPVSFLLGIKLINGSIRYAREVPVFTKSWWYGIITFPFSHRVIANSKAGLASHYLKPTKRNRYVHNGFDFNYVKNHNGTLRREILVDDEIIIAMVANFYTAKDQISLIKACIRLLNDRNEIQVVFIGEGPKRKETEDQIPIEFKNCFHFLGRRQDVHSLLPDIDIGVLLSLKNHAEGISNSIMEYMANEKPVIATNVGGNPELIEDGKTGYLIPHEDVLALEEKIKILMYDSEKRIDMGRKGRIRLAEQFSLESMVEKYISIYKELVN
jgi:glycosyltransferase involved in cell wall biosynthesis